MGGYGERMKRKSLYFTGVRQVEIREETLKNSLSEHLHLRALYSLISAGTEMLIYRGELPEEMPIDENLSALGGSFSYPLKYGYSTIGKIISANGEKKPSINSKRSFAFNPHESQFYAPNQMDLWVPDECDSKDALFLANMESAINVILDANIRIGDKVVVIGLGVLGLLTSALLLEHPLADLILLEPHAIRRKAASGLGAKMVIDSSNAADLKNAKESLGSKGADTVIELSGNPEALNLAMELVGAEGKIIVGSWYGMREAKINLGIKFHRGRIKIISSQVGRINPTLSGRWDRARRFSLAWQYLAKIKPSQWITHLFPFDEAQKAFRQIDKHPEQSIAVALDYH
jgi:2-desacetyl-2-hydroxyethyl bacteriochlorophyllide A dehydrogenase